MITEKHRDKVLSFFDSFLASARAKGRISVKRIQRMLGLQIWICTVFRVARQFLTSVCDILKISVKFSFFYTRRHPALVARAIQDLGFWRRFVCSSTEASFNYLLNRLPINDGYMSCDASTSWGMGGAFHFVTPSKDFPAFRGLFWQISWDEWKRYFKFPGPIKINAAEFLAILITCETFFANCARKLTYIDVDNTAARAWFDSARCPLFPYDRCAQGVHLNMIRLSMKVRARWIPSSLNTEADVFSRTPLTASARGIVVCGAHWLKVKPCWRNVLKYV